MNNRWLVRCISRPFLRALPIAVSAAGLCIWLNTPLPWMIGPIIATAAAHMGGVALCNITAILVAAGFGLLLAGWSGLHPATAILATAPGGIAEMALTAKNLQLGVPIVTAFHVTRMTILVLSIGPLFRLMQRT